MIWDMNCRYKGPLNRRLCDGIRFAGQVHIEQTSKHADNIIMQIIGFRCQKLSPLMPQYKTPQVDVSKAIKFAASMAEPGLNSESQNQAKANRRISNIECRRKEFCQFF